MELTASDIKKIEKRGLKAAERNLTSGIWKLKTAQFFLRTIAEQPGQHAYLIQKKR